MYSRFFKYSGTGRQNKSKTANFFGQLSVDNTYVLQSFCEFMSTHMQIYFSCLFAYCSFILFLHIDPVTADKTADENYISKKFCLSGCFHCNQPVVQMIYAWYGKCSPLRNVTLSFLYFQGCDIYTQKRTPNELHKYTPMCCSCL